MRTVVLLALLSTALGTSQGQSPAHRRHVLIDSLYRSERHAELVRVVDAQLDAAPGTNWADSIYQYLYAYGRANWKLHGPDRGMEAAERVMAQVDRLDGDPLHRLDALGDLSWLYYEVGRLPECLRVDSLALHVALSADGVPALRLGKAHQYLGFDHSMLGDHGRAVEHFLAAKEVYDADGSIPVMYQAETCNGIGASYWHLGRTRDAEAYYREALDLLGDPEETELIGRKASTVGNLGILWEDAGDLTRSKQWYEENLRLNDRVIELTEDPFERDEAILNRARTYSNLAALYFSTGDHSTASRYLDLSEKGRSQVLEPDDPQLLSLQERRADLALAAGRPEEAGRVLRAYVDACEGYYGERSEHLARALSKQAEVAAELHHEQEAEALFGRSIGMQRGLGGQGAGPVLALTLRRRARFHLMAGRTDLAIKDLVEARAILEQVHGTGSIRVAEIDLALVEAAVRAGDRILAWQAWDQARTALDERFRELEGPAIPQAHAIPQLVTDAVYWQVVLLRHDHPDSLSPDQQLELLRPGMQSLARNKGALLDEGSRLVLVGSQERLFDLALEIASEAEGNAQVRAERFFQLAETDRAILLKSRLNTFSSLRFTGVPDTLLRREAMLLKTLKGEAEDEAPLHDRQGMEVELHELMATLERDHPAYFALRYGERPVTFAQVREALLTTGNALLEFAFTDTGLHALVLRTDTALLLRLPARGLQEDVDRLNRAVADRQAAPYLEAAHRLYRRLLAPLAPWLGGRELLIVPDGPLHRLNMEVLLDAPCTMEEARDHLLLRRHAVGYLLSATTAVQFHGLGGTAGKGALALAPGFSDQLKDQYRQAQADSSRWDRDFLSLVRQPFMLRTARHVGELFRARLLMAGEATEARFREEAGRHGILHLGTHAEMNGSDPLYSRLVLSKDGASLEPDADGYLHAYEIYEMQLRAELAVLSACETGAGNFEAGEGVRSLAHSFAYAGCPSLVMALWQVDEKSTAEILDRFYDGLADGLPKHEALRRAKLDFLDRAAGELALPYYWGGLVLVGDVTPVEGAREGLPGWAWMVLVLVAILLVYRFARR